jgi:P4 family phage/plasmid primase-like protien
VGHVRAAYREAAGHDMTDHPNDKATKIAGADGGSGKATKQGNSKSPKAKSPPPWMVASLDFAKERLDLSGLAPNKPTIIRPVRSTKERCFDIYNAMTNRWTRRHDREENKYIGPKGVHDIYVPTKAAYDEVIKAKTWAIVEGQLKRDSFWWHLRIPCVSANGCDGALKKGTGKLLPSIIRAAHPGDKVLLVFDGDMSDPGKSIGRAVARIARLIKALGCVTEVIQLPTDKGIDDWIMDQDARNDCARLHAEFDQLERVDPDTLPSAWLPAVGASHHEIAMAVLGKLEAEHNGIRPVYTQGSLWTAGKDGLWTPIDADVLANYIGEHFGSLKLCKRVPEWRNVAWAVEQKVRNDLFFDDAPIGIAGPEHFWRVDGHGKIKFEALGPEHKIRNRLNAEPDFRRKAPRFEQLLDHALGKNGPKSQYRLLQCLFGAALTRSLWLYQIVGLLYGETNASKSTLLNILRNFFTPAIIGATNPQRWDNEYYIAMLAGKALNIVGELDSKNPIPGGIFKQVTGRDLVDGRHPSHRPFTFICQASHFFNSNKLPPTSDHSDAFFRRWRILEFINIVQDVDVDEHLEEHIMRDESGQVVAWMLNGASDVVRNHGLPTTMNHEALINKWRNANNSALQFINDPAMCLLDSEATTSGIELFKAYGGWASPSGIRYPMGRNGFYEALAQGAGRLGVVQKIVERQIIFKGVKLLVESKKKY